MGQPVVHFEVIGKDGAALMRFCTAMFGFPAGRRSVSFATSRAT